MQAKTAFQADRRFPGPRTAPDRQRSEGAHPDDRADGLRAPSGSLYVRTTSPFSASGTAVRQNFITSTP
jgi:hypothetical protein